jgi:hypothetical protein
MKSSARPIFFHIPASSFRNNGIFDCFDKELSRRYTTGVFKFRL